MPGTNRPDEGMSALQAYHSLQARIAGAVQNAGRSSDAVTLVAVSKTFEVGHIAPILDAGQRIFGENRVQEAMGKWPGLRERCTDAIELHLLGPLQSNKAKEAVATFDVIESIDREKIAGALANEMAKQGRSLPCYVQVNSALEPQKAGVAPLETAAFVARCREVHGLNIIGLMCIPPANAPPEGFFDALVALADETGLPVRSMGMSGDFEVAIAHGATHVRVGSALFGARG